jgi:hypothetical protein
MLLGVPVHVPVPSASYQPRTENGSFLDDSKSRSVLPVCMLY